ncbi:M3 family metallopeptidase [Thalassoroseus pseudoceratinae]|uniref:M3 family metallopeptidase n=1 Tax=Thalassoroseus pseudoceratinae TaxID=2713176 RepID=UPI001423108F|nr:M3 family metallopeptidase [Thalassoroseus pseudoceratinae]
MTDTSQAAQNPLLATSGLPKYDQIEPSHIAPAADLVLSEAETRLGEIEKNLLPTWEGCIEPLDANSIRFQWAQSPLGHLLGVKNSPELRDAWEAVRPRYVEYGLRLGQSQPVYEALQAIRDGEEWHQLDGPQQRIVESELRGMKLSGIGLDGAKRERFNEIANELSKLATDFSNHVLDSTKAFALVLTHPEDVEGMPASALEAAADSFNKTKEDAQAEATAEAGPWRFTLDIPSYMPFMKHAPKSQLRERMYRAFMTRASEGDTDNTPLIDQILKLRREQAELLGFKTYAEVSLSRKMAPSVSDVEQMFETLCTASYEHGKKELEEVREIAKKNGVKDELNLWDIPYWSERLREQKFQFTDEELRPYFSLERVLDGLFELCHDLFGITVKPADGEAPVWHSDVRFFHINNEDGEHIASFYLDPYSRPENKQGGAWMDVCLGRRRDPVTGELQLPVAHLVCNSTPPVGEKPSLMTFREVETLFHEFGHGLQHMMTTVDYSDAAGINGVEWDAVELPSQFMENWCYHKPTLLGMTKHWQTGEPLPEELFEKICQARTFQAGLFMLRQLNLGMTDMQLHHQYDPNSDETVFDVQHRVAEKTSLIPPLPEDRFLCAFQHIFAGGYAAGYYSYKWAEVLSADAFSAFEEAGLDNDAAIRETGRRFRDTVLSKGGGQHPMDIFKEFRGREPSPEPLLRHNGLV